MLGRVKKWLGIEGVKLELVLPEEIDLSEGLIHGQIRFYSLNPQTVTAVRVIMIERFTRGRRSDKMTDEFELGKISMEKDIIVPAEEVVEIDFTLPFRLVQSEMDEMESRNPILGGLVKTAKWIRGVSSEYSLLAEARVKGVALNPFDKRVINS